MPPTPILVHAPLVMNPSHGPPQKPSTPDPSMAWLVAGALFALFFCAMTAVFAYQVGCLRARARRAQAGPRKKGRFVANVDLENQLGAEYPQRGPVSYLRQPLASSSLPRRSLLTAADVMGGGVHTGSGKARDALPLPAAHTGQRSFKMRELVLCKALGALPGSCADRLKPPDPRPSGSEKVFEHGPKPAHTGDDTSAVDRGGGRTNADTCPSGTTAAREVDKSNSTLTCPAWVRPYLPQYTRHAKEDRSASVPRRGFVTVSVVGDPGQHASGIGDSSIEVTVEGAPPPFTVELPDEDDPEPGSPTSVYSQDGDGTEPSSCITSSAAFGVQPDTPETPALEVSSPDSLYSADSPPLDTPPLVFVRPSFPGRFHAPSSDIPVIEVHEPPPDMPPSDGGLPERPPSPKSFFSTSDSVPQSLSDATSTPQGLGIGTNTFPSTAHLASPINFYFPASPSCDYGEYLRAPPPSWNAPREDRDKHPRRHSPPHDEYREEDIGIKTGGNRQARRASGRGYALAGPPSPLPTSKKARKPPWAAHMQTRVWDSGSSTTTAGLGLSVESGSKGWGHRRHTPTASTPLFASRSPSVVGAQPSLQPPSRPPRPPNPPPDSQLEAILDQHDRYASCFDDKEIAKATALLDEWIDAMTYASRTRPVAQVPNLALDDGEDPNGACW